MSHEHHMIHQSYHMMLDDDVQALYLYSSNVHILVIHLLMHFLVLSTGFESNFERENTGHSTTQGIPYDYDSIMHYEAFAFSRDISQPTIEPVNRSISLNRLGQRRGFSELDLHHVNVLYCGGKQE